MTGSRSVFEKEKRSALMRTTKGQCELLSFEKLLLEIRILLVPSGKRAFGAEARFRSSCFGATNSKVS